MKNAILTLLSAKNGVKTAILACETPKSVFDENVKIIYLSCTKALEFSSIKALSEIDAFACGYLNIKLKDLIIKNQGGEYYLYEYEVIKAKKKEIINFKQRYKLSQKLYEKLLPELNLNFDEGVKVLLSLGKDTNFSNESLVSGLESGEYHLFDKMLGENLL